MLFISSYNALTPEIFRNVIDRMVTGMMVRDRIVAMSPLDFYLVNMVGYTFSVCLPSRVDKDISNMYPKKEHIASKCCMVFISLYGCKVKYTNI